MNDKKPPQLPRVPTKAEQQALDERLAKRLQAASVAQRMLHAIQVKPAQVPA